MDRWSRHWEVGYIRDCAKYLLKEVTQYAVGRIGRWDCVVDAEEISDAPEDRFLLLLSLLRGLETAVFIASASK